MDSDNKQDKNKDSNIGCIVFIIIAAIASIFMTSKEEFSEMGNIILGFGGIAVGGLIIYLIYKAVSRNSSDNSNINQTSKIYNNESKTEGNDKKGCLIMTGVAVVGIAIFAVIMTQVESIQNSDVVTAVGIIALVVFVIICGIYFYNSMND